MQLTEVFKSGKQFIPFITCGYPNKKSTVDIIKTFLDEGVQVVEIGIPFSDPVADGPTIQYSSYIALQNKVSIKDVFFTVENTLKYKEYCPVIMTYLNPVIIYGVERFFKHANSCGVQGIIFADAIVEEKELFYDLADKYKINCIFLLSPTTVLQRRRLIYKYSTGFIYLVTVAGTTGARKKLPTEFYNFVKTVRKETDKPLCVGFGISSPQQVVPILKYIDGFIVGSAIIDVIRKNKSLSEFIRQFVELIRRQHMYL